MCDRPISGDTPADAERPMPLDDRALPSETASSPGEDSALSTPTP
ncbi:hypothetical protein ACFW3Z_20485 [Nocardiopsis alba]